MEICFTKGTIVWLLPLKLKNMKKIEKFIMAALIVAMMGVVVFWWAGFKENYQLAAGSFLTAGISAWIAIIAIGLKRLRYGHLC